MAGIIESHGKAVAATIDGLLETVRSAWVACCKHDNIDPSSKFCVFSEDNPFAPYHIKAVQMLNEATQNGTAFGYEGLVIAGGKASFIKTKRKTKATKAALYGTEA